MKPLNYYEVRVRLLNKEVKDTNELLESHKEEWKNYECYLICDGRTDRRGRILINFLVNYPKESIL